MTYEEPVAAHENKDNSDHRSRVISQLEANSENGNCYKIIGYILELYRGYIGIVEKKMETIIVFGLASVQAYYLHGDVST